MDEESLLPLNDISDDQQVIIGSYLPIGSLISDNTSKDMVEYLLTQRIKQEGDNRRYYWFPISFNRYNIFLARVTVVCNEYIVGIIVYKLPSLTTYTQWKYNDNIVKRVDNDNNGLDYDIIERMLINKHDTLYQQLIDIFTYMYNMGYWSYGAFKDYKYRTMTKYDKDFELLFAPQRGIRLMVNVNGEAYVIKGELNEEQKEQLGEIGIRIKTKN